MPQDSWGNYVAGVVDLDPGSGGSFNGGGSSSGIGAPTASTTGNIYIQTDSDPPGLLWEYYSGAWH